MTRRHLLPKLPGSDRRHQPTPTVTTAERSAETNRLAAQLLPDLAKAMAKLPVSTRIANLMGYAARHDRAAYATLYPMYLAQMAEEGRELPPNFTASA